MPPTPGREFEEEARAFFGCVVDPDFEGGLRHGIGCSRFPGAAFACPSLAALLAKVALEERERCAAAIRAACGPCAGKGWMTQSVTRETHGCDGSESSCSVTCPVPVEDYEQAECEYCGRPIAALRAPEGGSR